MADTIKSLYFGGIPTTQTNVYTVPNGKYTVVKSIMVANPSNVDRTFSIVIGGIYFATGHTIKAGDTFVFDEVEIPLLTGESILLFSSATGASNSIMISGFESDYVAQDYPYVKATGALTSSFSNLVTLDSTKKWILKGLYLSNAATISATASVVINNFYLTYAKPIRPYDSLIVPLPNIVIPDNSSVRGVSSTNSSIQYGVILEKVVQ